MNPKKHPNAAAGGLNGLLTSAILYEANKRGVPIDAFEASVIVSLVVSVTLWLGKKTGVGE